MKAWRVNVKDEFCVEVVFAETRGKAKTLALSTDTCEDAHFTEIEACRLPQLDKYYKEGKWHFDWENPKDRIVLVKECGFHCDSDYFDLEDCDLCSAREYCSLFKDKIQEQFELEEMAGDDK